MAVERPPGAIGFMFRIKMQHDSCDFTPVSTFHIRVKQAQIRDEVAALAQDGGNPRRPTVELAVEGRARPAALAQHLADRNATGGGQGPGGKTTP